ncbi:MAG: hypothetical protein QOJ00_1277 [Actinomycetota bacterium]|jgi:ATP/maltotriose-dependent transcriptional regulator MalT
MGGLDAAYAARERYDWQRCHDTASTAPLNDALGDGERLALLGEAAWWLGHLDDSIEARQAAFRAFEEAGEGRRAGYCAVWLYEANAQRARPAIASGWLMRARRALEHDDNCVEHGALLLREAELAHGEGRLGDATDLAERALALGRKLASPDLEAEALQTVGRVLIDAGQVNVGLAHLDEAMLFAVEGRLGPYSTGKVYCSLISVCEDLGDWRRAADWTEATTQWAQAHPFAIFPGICRVHRAAVLDRSGALADAEREASQACNELVGSHIPNAAAAFAEVGDIRRRLGDLVRAEEAFSRAEALGGRVCTGTAMLRLSQNRIDEASRIIAGCVAELSPNRLARARVLPIAAQIAIAAGDLDLAKVHVTELDAIGDAFEMPYLRAVAMLARGRLQLAEGDPITAQATLHRAHALWRELGVPYEAATANTVLAVAQRDAGDEAGAQASFAAARALFKDIGVSLDARDTTAQLPAGLSQREAEVLRWVAKGLSNKEVATQLHLSAKTVSRHVSNIFTKVGVSSRVAASAFAFANDIADPHS